jgi:O-antigen/teichoic acid export membrane protein
MNRVAIETEGHAPAQERLASKAAKGLLWIGLEMLGSQGISFLSFAVMSRFVSPSDFGLVSVTFLFIYTVRSLMIDNAIVAIARKKQAAEVEYATGFWLSVSATCLATVLFLVFAGTFERLMHAPGLASIMREMSPVLLFMGLGRSHEMRLYRSFQFRTLAIRGIVGPLSGGGIGVALGMLNYGLSALVVQQIVTAAISLVMVWTSSSWRPAFAFEGRAAIEIMKFVLRSIPATIVTLASESCDTFLLAYFFGITNAGLYSVAKRLKIALQTIVVSPFNGVVFSVLAEIQDEPDRLRDASRKMIALILFVCVPIFIGGSLISRELILLCFGERWVAVAPIFSILVLGGVFVTPQYFCDTIFNLKNRQIWSFYYLLIYTTLAIFLFFVMRAWGSEYLALPFVLPYAIAFPFSATLVSKLTALSFSDWLRIVAPSTISAGAMFVAVRFVELDSLAIGDIWGILIYCAVGGLVYLGTMLVLDRRTVLAALEASKHLVYR